MFEKIARRVTLGGMAAVVLGLTMALPAAAQDKVKIGMLRIGNPVVIGIEKGFFAEYGVEVEPVYLRSGAEQIPALSTGSVDVVLTSASAAIYNAMVSGIDMKITSDYLSLLPGNMTHAMVVRKDLFDSGEVKSVEDLKGHSVAITAVGVYTYQTAVKILEGAGLKADDVRMVSMPYPDMVAGLANGAVDAANMTEPFITQAVEAGDAVVLVDHSKVFPDFQVGITIYGPRLAEQDRDLGERFMKGLVKSMRYMRGMLDDPARKAEISSLMQKHLPGKDPEMYQRMAWQLTAKGQKVNLPSLEAQMEFYRDQGLVKGDPDVASFVDTSFLEAADAE